MTRRCLWTGEWSDRAVEAVVPGVDRLGRPADAKTVSVLPEHEAALRRYAERAQRTGRAFLLGVVGLAVGLVVAVALGAVGVVPESAVAAVVGWGTAAMGALVAAFPFATPETVAALGVRRSMTVARVAGAATVALGVWIALAA